MTGDELEALALGRSLSLGGGGRGARVRFATVRSAGGGRAIVELDGGRVELPDASGMGAGAAGMRCAVVMDGHVGVVVGVVGDEPGDGGDYLPLAGGQLTGPVTVKTSSSAVSEEAAAGGYGNGVGFCGANGTRNANLQLQNHADGLLALRVEARRTVNGTLRYNTLKIGVDQSGSAKYEISAPAALRSAAGACSSDCVTATVAQRTALTTSLAEVPMSATATSGTGLSMSGGKVKCGFSGTVMVSAAAFFRFPGGDASPGVENPAVSVTVDGVEVASASVVVPGAWGTGAAVPPRLVQVSNGSLIGYAAANNTAARGELTAAATTYMTVQRVS